ncbi:MAG: hypothetical protein JSS00_13380 [Proteobacteria bacterium]|nr:hypothetical protein [Pseudomonadota bacterium]
MRYAAVALGLALFTAGCETMSDVVSSAGAPAAPMALGDWTHAAPAATLAQFEGVVATRYTVGSSLSDAAADLRRSDFSCAANVDTTGRGDPPAQICRRTVTAANCTGTWQVHLFDAHGAGRIARARALFDRRCGREGLLGGPS